jgi:hypothetical protein
MFNPEFIGHSFPTKTVKVEEGKLKFFSQTIGETNPIYLDKGAAKDQGHRSILAPPTYSFSLTLEGESLRDKYEPIGLELGKLLHGAQSFEYFGEICAGDTVIIDSKIVDIFQKKNGALDFCIEEMVVKNVEGETLAVLTQTFIMRH